MQVLTPAGGDSVEASAENAARESLPVLVKSGGKSW